MFKNYFLGIKGIEVYPLILLVVFMLFFIIMSVSLYRANREKMDAAKNLPLE